MGRSRQRKRVTKEVVEQVRAPRSPVFFARELTLVALALLAVVAFAYSPVIRNGFVYYDDPKYVTENPVVLDGLTGAGFAWALRTGTDANWFPLTWLSHMLDVEIFGTAAAGHHVTSVLLHIASTLLLLVVLYSTTRALWRSAFVAALFALHPLHVESVAWVAERKDVLSTFFLMLTLLAYTRYASRPSTGRYVLVALAFALGLMSKAMLVTLPFALLLIDFWPLRRFDKVPVRRLVMEKIPLLGLAVISSVITFIVQRRGGAVGGLDAFPLSSRIANALVAYVGYIEKTFWPSGLAAFYPYPQSISAAGVAAAIAILAAVTIVVIKFGRRFPYAPVGWLWYLGTLVPVIGIVQVGNQAMADRYTYIPLIGLFVILAWGIPDLLSRWNPPKIALRVAGVAVLAACAALTFRQVSVWRNDASLWGNALAVTNDNYVAHNNLGRALVEDGKSEAGLVHYNEALRIRPTYATARTNVGVALTKIGKYDEAITNYREALRLKPDLPESHANLGAALFDQGKIDEAIEHYSEAIRLNPNFAQAHANMGIALMQKGKVAEAISAYETALRLKRGFADVENNLGFALATQGRLDDAIAHYNEALRIKPDFILAHLNLGIALANTNRISEATREFREVLRLEPQNETARSALDQLAAAGK